MSSPENKDTTTFSNELTRLNNTEELQEYLRKLPNTRFCDRLDELSVKYKMTLSKIQAESDITRSYFYEFANGRRMPKKEHVIKIGIAMRVSLEELNELLKLAHHKELYPKKLEDAIIIFGIEKKLSAGQIDELLKAEGASFRLFE